MKGNFRIWYAYENFSKLRSTVFLLIICHLYFRNSQIQHIRNFPKQLYLIWFIRSTRLIKYLNSSRRMPRIAHFLRKLILHRFCLCRLVHVQISRKHSIVLLVFVTDVYFGHAANICLFFRHKVVRIRIKFAYVALTADSIRVSAWLLEKRQIFYPEW